MSAVEFAYELTPRAERILKAASDEAARRGHEYVGAEHIFWALMADPDSVPTQIAERAGVRAALVQQVEDAIGNSIPAGLVVDRDGNAIGRMTIGPNGEAHIVDDDGNGTRSGFINEVALRQMAELQKTIEMMSELLRACEPAVIYGIKLLENRESENYWQAMSKTVARWREVREKWELSMNSSSSDS